MPADATYLACNYFFTSTNNTNNSNTQQNTTNSTQKNGCTINKTQPSTGSENQKPIMELYKAKPQYLNTYSPVTPSVSSKNNNTNLTGLTNSIQCATSSLASSLNNSIIQSQSSEPSKNSFLLDLQWSKIKKIGTGLFNLGNNCYLNATLQCMAYTPSLSQWLVNRPHTPICKLKPLKGFCSLCEVEKIIYDIFNSCNGCAKPNSLCFNIKKVSNVFGVGTQEDASEFFTTLLESMAKSMKFTLNPTQQQQTSSSKLSFNVLDEIFSFQFRSRITCCNCGRISDTFENTNSWPVDVKYVTDIRKGMLHFLREEVLDGENSYKCDKCNRKVRATKKYSIQTAPNVLVINLKRFDFTYAGKLTHFVTYPETLSLKTFITEEELKTTQTTAPIESTHNAASPSIRNVTYKLYGVLVHLGYTSHSGHYYSYVRGPNDVWYKADDQTISTVRLQDAMDQNAYILFYNRIPQQQQPQSPNKNDIFLPPQPISTTFGPFIEKPSYSYPTRPVQLTNKETVKEQSEYGVFPQLNKNIPENKFKSTFIPVRSLSEDNDISLESQKESSQNKDRSNSNKTLDYDQVLKLKKIQKRKLKLYNRKKKLKELKARKKLLKAENASNTTENYTSNKQALKRIKKQIKELKKLIKKEKSKLKRLKKCDSCSSGPSSTEEDMSELEDYNCSLKRKNPGSDTETNKAKDDTTEKTNKLKKSKTTTKESNSLSLLKQYSSSASSSDDDDNELILSRLDRTRSSSSGSNNSTSNFIQTKQDEGRSKIKVEEREEGEVFEGEVDSSHANSISRGRSQEITKPRSETGGPTTSGLSNSSNHSKNYKKSQYSSNTANTNFWKNHKNSNYNHSYRYNNKYNKNYNYYRHKSSSTWNNHHRY